MAAAPILAKSLLDRRRALAWNSLGLAAMIAWLGALFPFLRDSEAFAGFLDNFPPELMAAFGIDPATYLTGAGFMYAYLYSLFAPLLLLIFVIGAVVSEAAAEERDGLMDMLLSAPVSRTRVFWEKAAGPALASLAMAGVMTAALLAAGAASGMGLRATGVIAAGLSLWLLGVLYGAAALLAWAVAGRPVAAGAAAGLLAVLSWFVSSFSGLLPWLEAPAAASPFTWYLDPNPLLEGWGAGQLRLLAATGAAAGAAVWIFRRRDIAAARPSLLGAAAEGPSSGRALLRLLRLPRFLRRTRRRPRAAWLLSGVFGKTLWDRRRSVWIWGAGLALLTLVMFAAWPPLARDAAALEGLVTALPREALAMFGITDPQSLVTAAGFLSSRTYQTIGPLAVILFAVRGVSTALVREEHTGALDLLLAAPAARRKVIASKAVAVALAALLVVLAPTLAALAGDAAWNTGLGAGRIMAAGAGLLLLGLFFGGLAMAVWARAGSSFPAVRVTAAAALASFLLNGLGALADPLAPVRALSPFYWYFGDAPPLAKGFQPSYLLLLFGALAALWAAVRLFRRRDLAV